MIAGYKTTFIFSSGRRLSFPFTTIEAIRKLQKNGKTKKES